MLRMFFVALSAIFIAGYFIVNYMQDDTFVEQKSVKTIENESENRIVIIENKKSTNNEIDVINSKDESQKKYITKISKSSLNPSSKIDIKNEINQENIKSTNNNRSFTQEHNKRVIEESQKRFITNQKILQNMQVSQKSRQMYESRNKNLIDRDYQLKGVKLSKEYAKDPEFRKQIAFENWKKEQELFKSSKNNILRELN